METVPFLTWLPEAQAHLSWNNDTLWARRSPQWDSQVERMLNVSCILPQPDVHSHGLATTGTD
jgi:hypothetical protein